MKKVFIFINRACKGFTLIELLVVISIIGVLLALSLVAFSSTKKSARDGKRKADLEQVRSALEIYRTDCKTYPATEDVTFGSPLVGTDVHCPASNIYMAELPQDPLEDTYSYQYVGAQNTYVLCAYLETETDTVTDCGGQCGTVDCNYKVINP